MRHERIVKACGAAALLAAAVTGTGLVGSAWAANSRAPEATAKKVLIKETNERYHYTPTRITVAKGATVTWSNKTDVEHNVTARGPVKLDKDIEDGKSVSITFTRAGTYHYHCEYHPYMKGTIVVK